MSTATASSEPAGAPPLPAHLRIVSILIGAAFLVHVWYLQCVVEDAFITFRFARNLVAGHGLVWNAGEAPVEGFTNFLWVLVSAAAMRVGLDVSLVVQALGVIAALATIVLTYRFAHRALGLSPGFALLPCLFLAASGPFATWAGSGMETNAFTLFVLAACYGFTMYFRGQQRRYAWLCALALVAATLTRPEGALFATVLALLLLIPARRGSFDVLRGLAVPAAACALLLAVYTVWRWQYFGALLPNTFTAKTGGGWFQVARGGMYAAFFATTFVVPLLPIPVWLGRTRRPQVESGVVDRGHVGRPVCAAAALVYTLYVIAVGGDYMAMYRFFVPVLPMIYLLFAGAVSELRRRRGDARGVGAANGLVIVALAATVLQSTPLEERLFPKPPLQHGTWRGVQTERWHVARLGVIADFFATRATPEKHTVATQAIGVIGYRTGMDVIDTRGIVDTHIARLRPSGMRAPEFGIPGHDKEDPSYVFSRRPAFYMFSRVLAPKPLPPPEYPDEKVMATIRNDYELQWEWLVDEVNGEEGYFTWLELREVR